jgi:hypothetical protein
MTYRKFLIGWVLVLSLLMAPVASIAAQEKSSGAPAGSIEAMALLKRAADFLSQSAQFSVTIRTGYDVVQASGQSIEFGEIRKITLKRPDRFRSDIERSDGEKGFVTFDGKDIVVFHEKDKVYAKSSRPGDLDGAVTHLLSDLKMRLPLAMLLLSRLPMEIEKRVQSVEEVERTVITDVPCAHLAARTQDVDFQIWIPSSGDPLPRRIVITYKNESGRPQFWANFSEWNLSPNPADSLFTFSPAEGTREIPFLAQLQTPTPGPVKGPARKKGGKQ